MSEPIVQRELFTYDEAPFHFYEIGSDGNVKNTEKKIDLVKEGLMFNHWHDDLEFCYTYTGRDNHYINGNIVEGKPGRLIVTNSQFIHNITVNDDGESGITDCVVVLIDLEFINDNFPEYRNIYLTNERETASVAVKKCFDKILNYIREEKHSDYACLYGKSLILELLYLATQEGYVEREAVDDINILKNIERMKGIVSFIENHYMEHITQAYIAKKFYFSSEYFSKYFKRCTGLTFIDYLTKYRIKQAKNELLSTDKSILEIALDNGFTDERRLIIAFKKNMGDTPLQYKKRYRLKNGNF